MPLSTTTDFLDAVKRKGGRLAQRAGDPLLSPTDSDDEDLQDLLDDALVELAMNVDQLEAKETIDVEDGTASYDAPPHLYIIRKARLDITTGPHTTTYKLDVATGDRIRSKVDAALAQGKNGTPSRLGVTGGQLHLFPVPSEAGTLRLYFRQNGHTTDGGAEPPAPTRDELLGQVSVQLQRATLDYVLALWYDDTGQNELANNLYSRWNDDVQAYGGKQNITRTTTRSYRPLGL